MFPKSAVVGTNTIIEFVPTQEEGLQKNEEKWLKVKWFCENKEMFGAKIKNMWEEQLTKLY